MSHELVRTYASLPRTARGVPIIVSGDPKGKNFLYTNGNSVIIRDIANPEFADVYTEHSTLATAAQYSPSGFYIASGDQSGKIRIWDTTQKEHILKNEFQPLGGMIKDISWSGDSQRIAVGGEGRERFGHVFSADSGTSVGEIMGQSKPINAVAFRPQRPFRIATASEDSTVAFFHGPPFKFQFTLTDHDRFVNAVKYSHDGQVFISGGADGKAFIYDGVSGEKKAELGLPAHKGGIYAISFSSDSSSLLTVSGDKTAKIWDLNTCSMVNEFKMGSNVHDMQVGCLWQNEWILSVSLSGNINYLDKNNPDKCLRVIAGHNKPITAMAVDRNNVYTGSSDGQVCHWDIQSHSNNMLLGKGHSNQVQSLAVDNNQLASCGMDDSVIFTDVKEQTMGGQISLPSQPSSLCLNGDLCLVVCVNEILVLREKKIVNSLKVSYEPTCIALHPDKTEVSIGGADNFVRVYSLNGDTLTEQRSLQQNGAIVDLSYSKDGCKLAACDTYRRIALYQLPDFTTLISSEWCAHTAKVISVDWTPDSNHLASGSLDTNVIVWNPLEKMKNNLIRCAHAMSQVNCVRWVDDNTLVSTGQDSNLKVWSISH